VQKLLPPILFLIAILLMAILHHFIPLMQWVSPPYQGSGLILLFLGLGISAWHNRLFSRLGTNIHTFEEPGLFVVDGLFKISRNPMYLGFVLALTGIAVVMGSLAPFVIVLLFLLITDRWYIPFEERAMTEKFGGAYRDYSKRVRRWL
jgi:protein-S-isoprenylcysteine O-methyltransferase Ste14